MANQPLTASAHGLRPANLPALSDFRAQAALADSAELRTAMCTIRYAQCWEDADILLEALDIRPSSNCLSIASAGDNTLAMLAKFPARIVAIDMNPAQLACLELRVAAYRELEHAELLEFVGSRPSLRRRALYLRCRPLLTPIACWFWDTRPDLELGIGAIGKFERYFADFRRYVLPLLHSKRTALRMLELGTAEERADFFRREWNTVAWRIAFRMFFSRFVMGRLGRDRSCFQYANGNLAAGLLQRARHAMVDLDPAANPYAQWILFGLHLTALPYALRPENFDAIRANVDRLELRCMTAQQFAALHTNGEFDRFNLSDVFEYMSQGDYERTLRAIAGCSRSGARLAYWNLLAPRRRPESMAGRIRPLRDLSCRLHAQEKTFFYSDFVVEEVL